MYLVDTNIWLEQLLAQAKSSEVAYFLNRIPSNQLFITDFAFHSICVILTRLQRTPILLEFIKDVFIDGSVSMISILPDETSTIINAMQDFRLDFDDAYQYVAADRYDLLIISFDSDFNRTPKGRKTPAEIVMAL